MLRLLSSSNSFVTLFICKVYSRISKEVSDARILFENHRKSLNSHLTFSVKLIQIAFKNSQFGEFLKTWSLWSNSVTRQVILIGKKLTEMSNLKNSNETFCVIFKQYVWSDSCNSEAKKSAICHSRLSLSHNELWKYVDIGDTCLHDV